MSKEAGDTKTRSKRKGENSDNREIKQKKTIAISSVIAAIVILFAGVIFGIISTSSKSYNKIEATLDKAGFKTYYNFDRNYYDRDGVCYEYDYSNITSCKREIGAKDVALFTIETISQDFQIEAYYYPAEKNKFETKMIIIEKDVTDDVSLLYGFNEQGDVLSLFYSDSDGDDCYAPHHGDNTDEVNYCDENKNKMLKEFQFDVDSKLNDLGLSRKDVSNYFDGYMDKYVIPKYESAMLEIGDGLTPDEIEEYIEDAGYTIETDDDTVLIYDYSIYSYKLLSYYPDQSSMVYMDSAHDGYSLTYFIEDKKYLSRDDDWECWYYIDDSTNEEGSVLGSCSETDKEKMEYLYSTYEWEIEKMNITQDELLTFVSAYYEKY